MDRATAKALREQLQTGLAAGLSSVNYSVSVGGGRYDPVGGNVTFKVTISEVDESGKAMTPERKELQDMLPLLGMPSDLEERTLKIGGREVKVIGYKSRSRRYPFLIEDTNTGERLKAQELSIKWALEGVTR